MYDLTISVTHHQCPSYPWHLIEQAYPWQCIMFKVSSYSYGVAMWMGESWRKHMGKYSVWGSN
jgi:hypothetical protein